jgi:hypothetical protein
MIEKNRPQFHENQKPPKQKTSLEMNEKPGDSPVSSQDLENERNDENRHGQENKERSGKKSAGSGDETLGIP